MPFTELILATGLFVISLLLVVYLVRYSNQQISHCLVSLHEKHNELVDLNGKLAKQIIDSDKKIKAQLKELKK
jgi:hypothetical protein